MALQRIRSFSLDRNEIVQRGLEEKIDMGGMLGEIMEDIDENNPEYFVRFHHIQACEGSPSLPRPSPSSPPDLEPHPL
jgi:hypothetical protein